MLFFDTVSTKLCIAPVSCKEMKMCLRLVNSISKVFVLSRFSPEETEQDHETSQST
jgi:hypothetical protein